MECNIRPLFFVLVVSALIHPMIPLSGVIAKTRAGFKTKKIR
jgi:hypothetical protein